MASFFEIVGKACVAPYDCRCQPQAGVSVKDIVSRVVGFERERCYCLESICELQEVLELLLSSGPAGSQVLKTRLSKLEFLADLGFDL